MTHFTVIAWKDCFDLRSVGEKTVFFFLSWEKNQIYIHMGGVEICDQPQKFAEI